LHSTPRFTQHRLHTAQRTCNRIESLMIYSFAQTRKKTRTYDNKECHTNETTSRYQRRKYVERSLCELTFSQRMNGFNFPTNLDRMTWIGTTHRTIRRIRLRNTSWIHRLPGAHHHRALSCRTNSADDNRETRTMTLHTSCWMVFREDPSWCNAIRKPEIRARMELLDAPRPESRADPSRYSCSSH
jgi:hypothetical protein